tara:strand:- start:472 stop:843 length:372 start_codon:yes stop_codon:yes gene_type:complete
MNKIAKLRLVHKHVRLAPQPSAVPSGAAQVAPAGNLPRALTPRDITDHAERVIRPTDATTPERLLSHRAKLRAALATLGEKWVCHPARRLGKQAHQHRDGIVAGLSFALATPVLVAHYVGWLA